MKGKLSLERIRGELLLEKTKGVLLLERTKGDTLDLKNYQLPLESK